MWSFLAFVLLAPPASPPKMLSRPSPNASRVASVSVRDGLPFIAVEDRSGRVIANLHPRLPGASNTACASISELEWVGEDAVAVTCHLNPSLNAFVEIEIATGRIRRDLLGYGFTRSPDGSRVAHVGWYPHFSPPFAKSNVLQVDDLVLYPLPAGSRPRERKGLDPAPAPPAAQGRTWSGIHEFASDFHWSPDSRRIAFIDCVFDWTGDPSDDSQGEEHGRRCSVAAVDLKGEATRSPLPELKPGELLQLQLTWTGPGDLAVSGPASLTLKMR